MSLQNREQLTNWYREVLKLADCIVTDDGKVLFQPPGVTDPKPVKLKMEDGVREMVLPIPSVLSSYDPKTMVAFHPIHEIAESAETPVILAFRKHLNIALNLRILRLVSELMAIAESPAVHRRLTTKQAELTRVMQEVPEGTQARISDKMAARWIRNSAEAIWVHMTLRRNTVVAGQKRNRVAQMHYPLMDQIDRINKALHDGRNIKDALADTWFIAADRQCIEPIANMIDFVFPERNIGAGYGGYSDSHQAPMLEAIVRAATAVGERINELVELYRNVMTSPDDCVVDLSWRAFATFDDAEGWASSLSPLRSVGTTSSKPTSVEQAPPVHTPQPQPQPTQPAPTVYQQPTNVPAPAVTAPSQPAPARVLTFAELEARSAPPTAPVPNYPHPNQQPVYHQPQPVYQAPPAPVNVAPVPGQSTNALPPGCRWAQDHGGNWVMVDEYNRIVQTQSQPIAQPRNQPGSAMARMLDAVAPVISTAPQYQQPRPQLYEGRLTDGRRCLLDANGNFVQLL